MKVSVIIPTHNRPKLLEKSVQSVLGQTYPVFEIIVIDDGLMDRARSMTESFGDSRIVYIAHEREKGGGAARNTGIKYAQGDIIAFLDDDDEWIPEKLEIQMNHFSGTSSAVGFCFSAVENIYSDRREVTQVPDGLNDYFETALSLFKAFLTVTLLIKKEVFDDIGYFDETLPSHQETDLVLRISKKYKGLGINRPLVKVNMKTDHERTGSSIKRRIAGREMILKKYEPDLLVRPAAWAEHLFWLGLFYRTDRQFKKARLLFEKALLVDFRLLYCIHYLSMIGNGFFYQIVRP
jgi:glycosyltransferase involved in cell wall biosynthesis